MQAQNKFFDDAAKVLGGTASAFIGLKREFEALIQQKFERLLESMDLVTRDEFESVRQMAVKARSEQEALLARLELLEKKSEGKQASKRRKANVSEVSTPGKGAKSRRARK